MMREYVNDVLYIPTGRWVEGMEYGRGSEWMRSMRDGHWERLHAITGLYDMIHVVNKITTKHSVID